MKILKNAAIVLVSVLCSLAATELCLQVMSAFNLIDLHFEYRENKASQQTAMIHPYLGFISLNSDNYFAEAKNREPEQDEIVVGIFGGSVASIMKIGEYAQHNFEEVLKKYTSKKVKVLNFAQGAYKQPQSLISLAYAISLGQKFDYIVLVDGFNEAFFPSVNSACHLPSNYPPATIFNPLIALTSKGGKNKEFMSNYSHMTSILKFQKKLYSTKVLQDFYVGRLIVKVLGNLSNSLLSRMQNHDLDFTQVDTNDSLYYVPPPTTENPQIKAAKYWANSRIAMDALAKNCGALLFHFIQPNQYVSNHHFSQHEESIAILNDKKMAESVKAGYTAILEKANELNASGHKVESLLDLFDTVEDEVYVDNCCHYNKTGEELLQNHIASYISKYINQEKRTLQ